MAFSTAFIPLCDALSRFSTDLVTIVAEYALEPRLTRQLKLDEEGIRALAKGLAFIWRMAVCDELKLIAVIADTVIALFDSYSGKFIRQLGYGGEDITCLVFRGGKMYISDTSGSVYMLDLFNLKQDFDFWKLVFCATDDTPCVLLANYPSKGVDEGEAREEVLCFADSAVTSIRYNRPLRPVGYTYDSIDSIVAAKDGHLFVSCFELVHYFAPLGKCPTNVDYGADIEHKRDLVRGIAFHEPSQYLLMAQGDWIRFWSSVTSSVHMRLNATAIRMSMDENHSIYVFTFDRSVYVYAL